MSIARHHNEWLSLVPNSGPFLSLPVLMRTFPQGLPAADPELRKETRLILGGWEDGKKDRAVQRAWFDFVLRSVLQFPPEAIAEGQTIPPGTEAPMSEFGEVLRPDVAILPPKGTNSIKPRLLVQFFDSDQDLEKPLRDKHWKASPATRMTELLHAADVPLGLITNGEHWMLVHAPRGETSGFASWYAPLWFEEPLTFQAFQALLNVQRFFGVAENDTIEALLTQSAQDQQEVTEQLGWQVRKAVEVLIQSLDKIDQDYKRKLLEGVGEKPLYEAALTIMMRLVFLMCAEERQILFLSDCKDYQEFYAISTLREQLQETADKHVEEILDARFDAWSRLLATFRAVYGGVQHEAMRLPPHGGTLFDPDRFPFLEGRKPGTNWLTTPAEPLKVSNRTVLHLLNALQVLQVKVPGGGAAEARRISFRALDIEQIGHVYEGLLDHTAKRASEPVLGLKGSKNKEPEIALSKMEELAGGIAGRRVAASAEGSEPSLLAVETPGNVISSPTGKGDASYSPPEKLVEFIREETGRSVGAIKRELTDQFGVDEGRLLLACGHDSGLLDRVWRFGALLRDDTFGFPVVIPTGSIYVTQGSDRRSTGTHYTPRSLTEPIVQYTLEPLVYIGPSEGTPRDQWKLKTARELLELKVCDMAMGSGAFLVQTCRYMAERLVEAWENVEKEHPGCFVITPEGELSTGSPGERLLPKDPAERLTIARRFVADRCLYGVDINPMAVEMAKLSLWLITLQKDRPFTFLDHALRCGDSLLGVNSVKQIENFSLRAKEGETVQHTFATANLFRYVDEATEKRRALEKLPSNDHIQIETKNRLHAEAEAATAKVKALADCLIAFELGGLDGEEYETRRAEAADKAELAMRKPLPEFQAFAREQLRRRRAFHWPVEFPEVFARGAFDAFLFNPPFRSGSRISTDTSLEYFRHIKQQFPQSEGNTDLCCYFIYRASLILRAATSTFGFLATNSISQGDNRSSTLVPLTSSGWKLCVAYPDIIWPGTANLYVSWIVLVGESRKRCQAVLNGIPVQAIDTCLTEAVEIKDAYPLPSNEGIAYKGVEFLGDGFKLNEATAQELLPKYAAAGVIRPWLNGADLTDNPLPSKRYAIDFADMSEKEAQRFSECFSIVEREVKPVRADDNRDARRERWWQYGEKAMGMRAALVSLPKALVRPFTSDTFFFRFISTEFIFTNALIVVCRDDIRTFTILNSSFHEVWARQQGSALKMDFRYTPSKCFATFPFPRSDSPTTSVLSAVGVRLENLRDAIMVEIHEGLTPLYNRFHDTGEKSEDIARLRALHVEMDRAVAAAYGWSDLELGHGFHETKLGVRYTISESARRTVLDRLLVLNHQRYAEEVKAGLHDKGKRKKQRKSSSGTAAQAALLRGPQGELPGL